MRTNKEVIDRKGLDELAGAAAPPRKPAKKFGIALLHIRRTIDTHQSKALRPA